MAGPKTAHDYAAESITEEYVERYVRPLTDPVAKAAHSPADLPTNLFVTNRIIAVEVTPRNESSRTIYENKTIRPPNDGMITGVPNAS